MISKDVAPTELNFNSYNDFYQGVAPTELASITKIESKE